jgi:hypothetical protein
VQVAEGFYVEYGAAGGFRFTQLPSPLNCHSRWEEINLKHSALGFGMAVSQHDLVAIVTARPVGINEDSIIDLHLMQVSTGLHHTNARHPIIFICNIHRATTSVTVEVVGGNVAVAINYPTVLAGEWDEHISIFKWDTGDLLLSISETRHTYKNFVFLSEDVIILPNTKSWSLEFWRVPSLPGIKTSFFHSLGLPEVDFPDYYKDIKCEGRLSPLVDNPSEQQPFLKSHKDSIINFTLMASSYSFVVHRNALIALLPSVDKVSGTFVPWNSWAPPITNWLPKDLLPWTVDVSDQRCVYASLWAPRTFHIRDFNPYKVRQFLAGKTPNQILKL